MDLSLAGRMRKSAKDNLPLEERKQCVQEIWNSLESICTQAQIQGSWRYDLQTRKSDLDIICQKVDLKGLLSIPNLKHLRMFDFGSSSLKLKMHSLSFFGLKIDLCVGDYNRVENTAFNSAIKSHIAQSSEKEKIYLRTAIFWSKYFGINENGYIKSPAWIILAAHAYDEENQIDDNFLSFLDFVTKIFNKNGSYRFEGGIFGEKGHIVKRLHEPLEIMFSGCDLTRGLRRSTSAYSTSSPNKKCNFVSKKAGSCAKWLRNNSVHELAVGSATRNGKPICSLRPVFAQIRCDTGT